VLVRKLAEATPMDAYDATAPSRRPRPWVSRRHRHLRHYRPVRYATDTVVTVRPFRGAPRVPGKPCVIPSFSPTATRRLVRHVAGLPDGCRGARPPVLLVRSRSAQP
jgi:hypothetical protein